LAAVLVGGLRPSFDLMWLGRSSGHRAVDRDLAAPTPPAQAASPPVPASASQTDRPAISPTTIRATDRQKPADMAVNPNLFSSTTMTRWKPSLGANPPAPSATGHAAVAQPQPTRKAIAAAPPQMEARITTPVPETRPTTIEGWTLREIVNGTAVLDGPGGSFRVARGDTVPGAGRVLAIFRWGNRLMVATSKGLISTP
jgi:hypothetical protein